MEPSDPLNLLKHHVTGALERGETTAIEAVVNDNARFDQACRWLDAYTGTFEFYLSLKSQLAHKGYLSDKQLDAVHRAIARDQQPRATVAQQTFSLASGTVLIVGKYFARQIAFQAGLARPHHALEVLAVEAETAKAWKLKVRLSAQRTTHCGICGAWLSNPESVKAGIGPICAERTGIAYGGHSLELLAEELSTTAEVSTWFPKSAVKERIEKSTPNADVMAYVSEGLGEF